MRNRTMLALGTAVAAFLAFSNSAMAVQKPSNLCQVVCPTAPCNADCVLFGTMTKCAVYFGNPANDWDSDGLPNTSDNCRCDANPNQADCDVDGVGDACDTQNLKWVDTGGGSDVCFMRAVTVSGGRNLQAFGSQVWRELCSNATCVRNILRMRYFCDMDFTLSECCGTVTGLLGASSAICGSINQDLCGTPKCTF